MQARPKVQTHRRSLPRQTTPNPSARRCVRAATTPSCSLCERPDSILRTYCAKTAETRTTCSVEAADVHNSCAAATCALRRFAARHPWPSGITHQHGCARPLSRRVCMKSRRCLQACSLQKSCMRTFFYGKYGIVRCARARRPQPPPRTLDATNPTAVSGTTKYPAHFPGSK